VVDTNGPLLIADLRERGCPLHELRVVVDEVSAIARAVRELSAAYEVVFTSGGVGPTHDDVTLEGIALGFGEPLCRNPDLERAIRDFYQGAVNEHVLRMADLPASATLVRHERLLVPVVRVRNVYVLPGEPTVFRRKWAAIRDTFRREPFHLKRIFTRLDESAIAGWLIDAERRHQVMIGSYPRYDTRDYAVLITVESKDAARVDAAAAEVVAAIEGARPDALVRVE
jgi:molybdenum cofactor synthesis domain-containing protein